MKKTQIFFMLVIMGLSSCASLTDVPVASDGRNRTKTGQVESLQIAQQQGDYLVSMEQAQKIATFQPFKLKPNERLGEQYISKSDSGRPYGLVKKSIKSTLVFQAKDKRTPSLYAFNYDGGGFIILSADKRHLPILAYSETNTFDTTNFSEMGVSQWVEDRKLEIEDLRNNRLQPHKGAAIEWRKFEQVAQLPKGLIEEPPADCYTLSYSEKMPMMPYYQWGQGCYYNELLDPCPSLYDACFKHLAGCGPIAIGQVMRYWQYPASRNWSAMPLNYLTSSNTPIAQLMKDIGLAALSIYGCPWGTATLESQVAVALQSFGYSATFTNHQYGITDALIVADLNNNRPVIFTGWKAIDNAHIWICDGYKQYEGTCYSYLYYSMNWGGYGANNGLYYSKYDWDGYNTGRNVIYNIHP